MREIEEITVNAAQGSGYGLNLAADTSWDWLPKDIEPVLENQPKWQLLKDVLKEIEENLYQAAESETGTYFTRFSWKQIGAITSNVVYLIPQAIQLSLIRF